MVGSKEQGSDSSGVVGLAQMLAFNLEQEKHRQPEVFVKIYKNQLKSLIESVVAQGGKVRSKHHGQLFEMSFEDDPLTAAQYLVIKIGPKNAFNRHYGIDHRRLTDFVVVTLTGGQVHEVTRGEIQPDEQYYNPLFHTFDSNRAHFVGDGRWINGNTDKVIGVDELEAAIEPLRPLLVGLPMNPQDESPRIFPTDSDTISTDEND